MPQEVGENCGFRQAYGSIWLPLRILEGYPAICANEMQCSLSGRPVPSRNDLEGSMSDATIDFVRKARS